MRILHNVTLLGAVAIAGAVLSSHATHAQASDAVESQAPPYNPVPRVAIVGEPLEYETMSEYADALGIPAVGYATFKDGKLTHSEFKGEGIGPDSLFQGASLAKSVASATIATLAEREGISLDEDIAQYITSFDLTALEGYNSPVTLRELLSHTSQADVGGFEGYEQSADLPTNVEVILGSEKSNTKRVAFSGPEGKWSYSGGGYQIAQAFAEDVSGKPFAQLAKLLVFDPVGMDRSSFSITMDQAGVAPLRPVPGNENLGPVQGGWHNYPELATAGLWTTAEDFGKFVVAVMAAAEGEKGTGISPFVAREMLTVAGNPNPVRGYGLGFGILLSDDGSVESFEHHGKNVGYRVSFSAFPKDRAVSVLLTNHPNGLQLAQDSNRGFGLSLGYVDPTARSLTPAAFSAKLQSQCLGSYSTESAPEDIVHLMQEDGKVFFRNSTRDYPLVHLGQGRFLYPEREVAFKCETVDKTTTLSLGSSTIYQKR